MPYIVTPGTQTTDSGTNYESTAVETIEETRDLVYETLKVHYPRQYEGLFYVMCSEDDLPPQMVASVGRFMPGPAISYEGPKITPPAMARAVAQAMIRLADEIDATVKRLNNAVDEAIVALEGVREDPPIGGWYCDAVDIVAKREGMNPYELDGMIGGRR